MGVEVVNQMTTNYNVIQISEMPSGVYFYKIENQEIGKIGQLIVKY